MSDEILSLIPDNWLELIDKTEIDENTIEITQELIGLASKQLGIETPNQDEVIIKASQTWNMTIEEVRDALRTVIHLRATTRLFIKHYGHLFPKDEEGNSVLKPAEIAKIHGKSVEEVLEAIEKNKEELKDKGLLFDWPEISSDYQH